MYSGNPPQDGHVDPVGVVPDNRPATLRDDRNTAKCLDEKASLLSCVLKPRRATRFTNVLVRTTRKSVGEVVLGEFELVCQRGCVTLLALALPPFAWSSSRGRISV